MDFNQPNLPEECFDDEFFSDTDDLDESENGFRLGDDLLLGVDVDGHEVLGFFSLGDDLLEPLLDRFVVSRGFLFSAGLLVRFCGFRLRTTTCNSRLSWMTLSISSKFW